MTFAEWIHYLVYAPSLALVAIFCLNQVYLLAAVLANRHRPDLPQPAPVEPRPDPLPFITIQLPLYNERFVVGRLLDCIADMDYPADRFEVQVLDDSTDDTARIAFDKVAAMRQQGLQATLLHRSDRKGFKAGALAAGMLSAKGSLIAIFDADFLPEPDFLRRALPYFRDPAVGVVQGRWTHLNEDSNLLTRLQALQLNVHFRTEQPGRQAGGFFLQFNGTAGIWRTEAIHAAGGWKDDTLTEDLELSIRAQLAGWKVRYVPTLEVPAELPMTIGGVRSQQYRWMKGGAETARRWLLTVIATGRLPAGVRWQAILHLLGSSVFLPVVLLSLASLWSAPPGGLTGVSGLGLAGLVAFFTVQSTSNWPERSDPGMTRSGYRRIIVRNALLFPLFLALSLGFSFRNCWAVLEGWSGRRSPFVRTPKYNVSDKDRKQPATAYDTRPSRSRLAYGEWLLLLVFLLATARDILESRTENLAFHLLLTTGYGMVSLYTLAESRSYGRSIRRRAGHAIGSSPSADGHADVGLPRIPTEWQVPEGVDKNEPKDDKSSYIYDR